MQVGADKSLASEIPKDWSRFLKPKGGWICFWFHCCVAAELNSREWTPGQNRFWPTSLPCQGLDLATGIRAAGRWAALGRGCKCFAVPCGIFHRRRKELKQHLVSKSAQANPAVGQLLSPSKGHFLWSFQRNIILHIAFTWLSPWPSGNWLLGLHSRNVLPLLQTKYI